MKVKQYYLSCVIDLILSIGFIIGFVPKAFNIHPILGVVVILLVVIIDYWLLNPFFKRLINPFFKRLIKY